MQNETLEPNAETELVTTPISVPRYLWFFDVNDTTTVTWTVKNFDMCPHTFGKALRSPEFSMYSWNTPKFHLMLYPRGINQETSDHVSLFLVKTDGNDNMNKITCNWEMGIVTTGERMACKKFHDPLRQGFGQGSKKLISREKLSSEKHLLLPDDNLTVFCEMSARKTSRQISSLSKTRIAVAHLSNALTKLYLDERYCDLKIITKDKEFKVHRAVLQARFPELLEKVKELDHTSVIEINVDASTMDALLQYLYSGILDISQFSLFDFVKSSHKIPQSLMHFFISKLERIKVTTSLKQKVVTFSWEVQKISSLKSKDALHYSLIGDMNCSWTWFKISLSVSIENEGNYSFAFSIERYSNVCKRIVGKIKVCQINQTFDHTYLKENNCKVPAITLGATEIDLDKLTFKIEIAATDGSMATEIEKTELSSLADTGGKYFYDSKSFEDDFKKLLEDKKYSDITLVCGKDEFLAHKCILSVRSPVFFKILQNESSENRAIITNLDSEVVRQVLLYIYTNRIDQSYQSTKQLIDLYTAANKYNISSSLETECLDTLKSRLDADRVGEILIASEKLNLEDLKECAYEFICSHPQEIADSKQWKETMTERSDLLLEILNRTLSHLASKK